ncbi:amidohydrolase family protein [Synergistaceae bacterium OttesenSCG-928-I11]|nr:amidohydrolase family protein [Synergistaceae bacterium OttesenSCG-928-I11]
MTQTDRITLIKNTSYVVAYDGTQHVLVKNGMVAFKGNEIIYAGKNYEGACDTVIDAHDGLVTPGFVNVHSHIYGSPVEKGFLEDRANPLFYMSGLYDYLQIRALPPEEQPKLFRFALAEMVKKGATTVFDMGIASEEMIDIVSKSGVRAYMAPASVCASWSTKNGHEVIYTWDEKRAYDRLEYAVRTFEKYDGTADGRLKIALYPGQVDTCTPEFFKEIRKTADKTGMRIQVHAAQAIVEYQKIVERHGKTPAAFLDSCGITGPDVLYGHYIFPSGHSINALQLEGELELIARTKTNISHCPWVFVRRGLIMESMDKYLKMGINMGIGTDTTPQDTLAELKWAAICSKTHEKHAEKGTAAQVFNMATLGGAKALGRDDIGRLSKGAKADILIIDTNNVEMRPLRDPIKALVYCGQSANINKVFVDGNLLVDGNKVVGVDEEALGMEIQRAAEGMYSRVKDKDWAGRTHEELSPMSFPVVE